MADGTKSESAIKNLEYFIFFSSGTMREPNYTAFLSKDLLPLNLRRTIPAPLRIPEREL